MTSHPNKAKPLVWVVDTAYTGELHARIGLAERLGYGYQLIPYLKRLAALMDGTYNNAIGMKPKAIPPRPY